MRRVARLFLAFEVTSKSLRLLRDDDERRAQLNAYATRKAGYVGRRQLAVPSDLNGDSNADDLSVGEGEIMHGVITAQRMCELEGAA